MDMENTYPKLDHNWYGRIKKTDFRDHQYRLRSFGALPNNLRYKWWQTGPTLNQGQTPRCVLFATDQYLHSGPVTNKAPDFNFDNLYDECRNTDGIPMPHDGTTVRAMFDILKTMGYVKNYYWAFDVETMIQYILTTGPMVLGTDWVQGMEDPNPKNGFVRVTGDVLGGHSYMVKGLNRDIKCPDGTIGAFRFINSWGDDWGYHGLAWISFSDMAKLLAEAGEACCATEIKKLL